MWRGSNSCLQDRHYHCVHFLRTLGQQDGTTTADACKHGGRGKGKGTPVGTALEILLHLELGEDEGLPLALLEALAVLVRFLVPQLGHQVQLPAQNWILYEAD